MFTAGTQPPWFAGDANLVYYHMSSTQRQLESFLSNARSFDVLAISAGFDRGVADWCGTLSDTDYRQIGEVLKHFSNERSQGRRFATLEGGYNHITLGASILSFLEGFE